LLDANQVIVEHRYFGDSKPDSLNYNYLNLEQATADLHRIRALLKSIYTNKWLSTGISKGGSTTLFYRYFYPEDVEVSIPYVAPLANAYEDRRIYHFLDTVGTLDCRTKIDSLQDKLFQNRTQVLAALESHSTTNDWQFERLGLAQAFEFAVLEFPFSFWQWGGSCEDIPDHKADVEELVQYFLDIDPVSMFNDESLDAFGPHYFQAANQMGYYGYEIEDFKNRLLTLDTTVNPHCSFLPKGTVADFDDSLLTKVHQWTQTEADQFLYIYGGADTWTACAVTPSTKVDSRWFVLPNRHHGDARIANMSDDIRAEALAILSRWLKTEIKDK
ncbi:MAG: hypothetical protein HRT61_18525, partial [Ekhidna sp.]|nr:hypothetical protein [Ekhidna sp.]